MKPEIVVEGWSKFWYVVIKIGKTEFDSKMARYTRKSSGVRYAKRIAALLGGLKVRVE
jgi:hypothetical protein